MFKNRYFPRYPMCLKRLQRILPCWINNTYSATSIDPVQKIELYSCFHTYSLLFIKSIESEQQIV